MSDAAATPTPSPVTPSAPAKADAAPAPAAVAATPPPAKHKFDFGDGEREYTFEELKTFVGKGRGADKLLSKADQRLKEAAALEAKHKSLPERLKKRDEAEKLLREYGVDPRAFAEDLLLPHVQAEMMSEEQRAVLAAQKERDEALSRLKAQESQREQAELEQQVLAEQERLGASIGAALEKLNYPETARPVLVPFVAKVMQVADEAGDEMSPEDAAEHVEAIFRTAQDRMVESMSGEQIAQRFGEAFIQKAIQYGLAKIKASRAKLPGGASSHVATSQPTNGAPKPRFKSMEEWEAFMESRAQE